MKKRYFRHTLTACVCSVTLLAAACSETVANCDLPNIGSADIGGAFTLIDEQGKQITQADVITKPTLVYFGYTYCPDFCPQDAANMARAAEMLQQEYNQEIGLVFVSIDPERDTPEVLQQYTDSFHDSMVGLTGSAEQVKEAAQAYKVYYARNDDPNYSEYLMSHSTFTYLVDKAGDYLTHFSFNTPPETIVEQTSCIIDATA